VGSGVFRAKITITDGSRKDGAYNAKKQFIGTAGKVVAMFNYPTGISGSSGTATLKVAPVIPDRMFGLEDNTGDTYTHGFLYLPVTNPLTGRTWLNNNLGAEYADTRSANFNPAQQAKSSIDHLAYGSLFQWGRKADGHELINWTDGWTGKGKHGVTRDVSNVPSHPNFIISGYRGQTLGTLSWREWADQSDDTLWANESSVNNVCPVGYRLPIRGSDGTNKEWEVEVDSWHTDNGHENTTSAHALASSLKLPMSGYRHRYRNTGVVSEGSTGRYWSAGINISTTTGIHYVFALLFNNKEVISDHSNTRIWGFNVRCIKDE
jgi:uncharacterized protein (TIGR02145 family)